jgi:hypothetical protein
MTPQEQAQAVADAAARARCLHQWSTVNDPPCHPSDEGWNGCHLCVSRAGDAAAIRAAVDLVLPEEPGPTWSDPREEVYDYQRQSRVNARARFLAIAAELEGPTNG